MAPGGWVDARMLVARRVVKSGGYNDASASPAPSLRKAGESLTGQINELGALLSVPSRRVTSLPCSPSLLPPPAVGQA
jgi:hypothetical protein